MSRDFLHEALISLVLEKAHGKWAGLSKEERAHRESRLNRFFEIYPEEKKWADKLKVHIETHCRMCGQKFKGAKA